MVTSDDQCPRKRNEASFESRLTREATVLHNLEPIIHANYFVTASLCISGSSVGSSRKFLKLLLHLQFERKVNWNINDKAWL